MLQRAPATFESDRTSADHRSPPSPRARVTTRIMEHAEWIRKERQLWDAMMASRPVVRRDKKWSILLRQNRWLSGETLYSSRDQAEARALADGWRAYREWIAH